MTRTEIIAAIDACFNSPKDETALAALNEILRPRICAILLSMYRKNFELVEDAYQSSFIKFMEIFVEGRKSGIAYDAYFVAIAKHSLVDELRKRSKQIPLDDLLKENQPTTLPTMEAEIAFLQALSRLNRRCQFALESYYLGGMDTPELARRLRISPESVAVTVSRCKETLKQMLQM